MPNICMKTKNINDNLLSINDFGADSNYNLIREEGGKGIYVEKSITDYNRHIYRYMEFVYLIQMLMDRILFIPNRQWFSDRRELSESNKKTLPEFINTFRPVPSYKTRKLYQEIEDRHLQIWNQAVSCWTYDSHRRGAASLLLDENYMMWACHSGKSNVCRIRSSINRIKNSILDLSHDILIANVTYLPIDRKRTANLPSSIFIKPEYYIDEDEVRLVALHNDRGSCDSKKPLILSIDPSNFIDEITVSPFASSEVEKTLLKQLRLNMDDDKIRIKRSILLEH